MQSFDNSRSLILQIKKQTQIKHITAVCVWWCVFRMYEMRNFIGSPFKWAQMSFTAYILNKNEFMSKHENAKNKMRIRNQKFDATYDFMGP